MISRCLIPLFILVSLVTSAENGQPLFNGKDFTGWKQLNGKAKYTIENGEIVGLIFYFGDNTNSKEKTEHQSWQKEQVSLNGIKVNVLPID